MQIPDEWRELCRNTRRLQSVLVFGATDTGKSTLIRFLTSELLSSGSPVSLINTDVGQSDVGPPATMSISIVRSPFTSYQELAVDGMYFIGTNSPSGNTTRCLTGFHRMLEYAARKPEIPVIVNTTGWAACCEAQQYKRAKLEMQNPGLVICFEGCEELEEIIRPYCRMKNPEIVKLPVSPWVKVRSLEERQKARMEKYRRYFQGSSLHSVNLRKVTLMGITWAELFQGDFTNTLIGLYDSRNTCRGMAILRCVDVGRTTVELEAPLPAMADLAALHPGLAKLEELPSDSTQTDTVIPH